MTGGRTAHARAGVALSTAQASQASQLYTLIAANREEGHLLPRTLEEVSAHAGRFAVAARGRKIVGCAELARLRARREGFDSLCAFTHTPAYFSGFGFSIVPHARLGEKIFTDCVKCSLFRRCGQYAMVMTLDEVRDGAVQMPTTPHHA